MLRKIIELIIAIAIPLLGGFLVSNFTRSAMLQFDTMSKPPLAPPSWLFPVAWTILYIFMGLGSFLMFRKNTKDSARVGGLVFYILQLIVNFSWSIVFFNMEQYLVAFLLLVLLWFLVYKMAQNYRKVSVFAFILTIPYLIWLTFAGYLNLGIALLN